MCVCFNAATRPCVGNIKTDDRLSPILYYVSADLFTFVLNKENNFTTDFILTVDSFAKRLKYFMDIDTNKNIH